MDISAINFCLPSMYFNCKCNSSSTLSFTTRAASVGGYFRPQLEDISLDHSLSQTRDSRNVWVQYGDDGNDDDSITSGNSSIAMTPRYKHMSFKLGKAMTDVSFVTNKHEEPCYSKHAISDHRSRLIQEILNSKVPVVVLSRVHKRLDPLDYSILLRLFATQRRWSEQHEIFEWMQRNIKILPPCFTTFFSSMGKAGFPMRALQTFRDLSDRDIRLNVIVCNSLFKALIMNGKVNGAFSLFNQLKSEGLKPNMETYRVLLSGCSKYRTAYIKADKFLREMDSIGLQPDSSVYRSLLNVCAAFGLEGQANIIRKSMRRLGIPLNRYHYSALLNLYAELKKPLEAEKILSEIRRARVPLDSVMLCSLIKVYKRAGLLEKARGIFDQMQSLGFPPDESAYCVIMDCYAKSGDVEEAHNLFREMKAKGINFGCFPYSILISSYSKLGLVDEVESLVEELNRLPRDSWSIEVFNNLLKTYTQLEDMQGIIKTLNIMDEERMAPDRATFNILISFFCKNHLFVHAKQTLVDLIQKGMRPNRNSYTPIILELVRCGHLDRAMIAYNEMRNLGIPPSAAILEPLTENLCNAKRTEDALVLMKDVQENDLLLQNTSLETIFISVMDDTQSMKDIFKSISPLNLEKVNFDHVVRSYEQQGHFEAAETLSQLIRERAFEAKDSHALS